MLNFLTNENTSRVVSIQNKEKASKEFVISTSFKIRLPKFMNKNKKLMPNE